jgi:hypothetical protein
MDKVNDALKRLKQAKVIAILRAKNAGGYGWLVTL